MTHNISAILTPFPSSIYYAGAAYNFGASAKVPLLWEDNESKNGLK